MCARCKWTAFCWGYSDAGQLQAPSEAFVEVAAGLWHSCARTQTGEVRCWGCQGQDLDQCDVPMGQFQSISAGQYHTCGITSSSEVVCWGCGSNRDYGQCDPPEGSFSQISAGGEHTCALSTTGTIECWGCEDNNQGQCEAPNGSFVEVQVGVGHPVLVPIKEMFSAGDETNSTRASLLKVSYSLKSVSGTFTAVAVMSWVLPTAGDAMLDLRQIKDNVKPWMVLMCMSMAAPDTAVDSQKRVRSAAGDAEKAGVGTKANVRLRLAFDQAENCRSTKRQYSP